MIIIQVSAFAFSNKYAVMEWDVRSLNCPRMRDSVPE